MSRPPYPDVAPASPKGGRRQLWSPGPLYATDEQISQLVLGSQANLWRQIVRQLEREGLPQPRQLFGGLRYVPAVLEFFHRREGFLDSAQDRGFADDGEERFEP